MMMMTKIMTKTCKIQPKKVMPVKYMMTKHKMLKLKKGAKW